MTKYSGWKQAQVDREARRKVCGVPFTEEDFYVFENGEEEHVIPLIKLYLLTPEQKAWLTAADLTIADLLNGRYTVSFAGKVSEIYADWNAKLKTKHFGN
jgi:hypothetical protein